MAFVVRQQTHSLKSLFLQVYPMEVRSGDHREPSWLERSSESLSYSMRGTSMRWSVSIPEGGFALRCSSGLERRFWWRLTIELEQVHSADLGGPRRTSADGIAVVAAGARIHSRDHHKVVTKDPSRCRFVQGLN